MIEMAGVSVTYADADRPILEHVDLSIPEGELVLVCGPTGSGKSTLLGLLNGLVPHFTGGHLDGSVGIAGVDTRHRPPRDLAHLVGMVGQNPLAGFVTDVVEDELAYAMEQLGVAPDIMRKRVEETLDLLGIAELRRRPLRSLSGGQQQRVAIGSVLTAHPALLVLDEPTSALDPTAAEDVLATVTRLVHDLGVTVVMAEHRMERVVQYADRLVYVPGDGGILDGAPADILATVATAPPVVRLGRLVGWSPLPLSVRDARRTVAPLRERLRSVPASVRATRPAGQVALEATGMTVRHGHVAAVRDVSLTLHRGQVLALMGRNGSGKSSLLWAVQGSGRRFAGRVDVDGADPADLDAARARRRVGLVPQSASDLLYLETVERECASADRECDRTLGTTASLLERMAPGINPAQHPRDLSEGQRLALVLAVQLIAAPSVMLLDEPTRGLDYAAKAAFARIIDELAAQGHSVVLASHDVELVAEVADRVVVMSEGDVVADGTTVHVLSGSPAFAPQVARILGAGPWLTVNDVERALSIGAEVTP
ncbi:MAG: ATP-binding cassette domain-containing protein [Nocardioidaceae bacterium]|jgi:energy-coupling factor transport system ATP-binding protein|nr:ATP-binding cassette domain-containing protein [Nocardioidaceae bacterium]